MRISRIVLLLMVSFQSPVFAQQQPANKIIYGELFGAGDVYSLNGEYLFKSRQSVRLGFSWFPGDWRFYGENERTYIYFPATYQYLFGPRNHKLETSGGLLGTWTLYPGLPNQLKITPQVALAYRYQRTSGGVFLRAGIHLFAPVFLSIDRQETFAYTGKHWYLWPGMALGWSF